MSCPLDCMQVCIQAAHLKHKASRGKADDQDHEVADEAGRDRTGGLCHQRVDGTAVVHHPTCKDATAWRDVIAWKGVIAWTSCPLSQALLAKIKIRLDGIESPVLFDEFNRQCRTELLAPI